MLYRNPFDPTVCSNQFSTSAEIAARGGVPSPTDEQISTSECHMLHCNSRITTQCQDLSGFERDTCVINVCKSQLKYEGSVSGLVRCWENFQIFAGII